MSDVRIQYTENMVGANHPTLPDTLNRALMIEHANSGAHANITPTSIICTGSANIAGQIISTVANGTAPFVVTSSTPVANLVCTGTNLPMTGEANYTSASTPATLSLGSVTAGDRVYVEGGYTYSFGSDTFGYTQAIISNTGSSTINCGKDRTTVVDVVALPHSSFTGTPEHWFSRVIQVTVSGTLTLSLAVGATSSGTAPTYANIELYAFFLKKQ